MSSKVDSNVKLSFKATCHKERNDQEKKKKKKRQHRKDVTSRFHVLLLHKYILRIIQMSRQNSTTKFTLHLATNTSPQQVTPSYEVHHIYTWYNRADTLPGEGSLHSAGPLVRNAYFS